jgi:tetratricopeptide (TPR) repeat protein
MILRAVKPGDVLVGRYRLDSPAGSGGASTVFRATDGRDGSRVAVKLFDETDPETRRRFEREARLLVELRHPAVVRYVEHGVTDEGRPFLVTEWLEGEDLAARLTRGPLSLDEALRLGRRVCEGLLAAHQRGVVHRDLKPGNLFLPGGAVEEAKVLDFGVARSGRATVSTRTGTVIGTPGYMAPEQVRGEPGIDARADVFALGCVLFECLTGRPTFAGEHLYAVVARVLFEPAPHARDLRADVPEGLDDAIARMLSKDPKDRPEDARAALAELQAPLATAPSRAGVRPAGIGRGEQRVFSVVMMGSLRDAAVLPSTRRALLDDAAHVHQGTLAALADGTVVVGFTGSGDATLRVAEAARCALALRSLVPGTPLVLATGRGRVDAADASPPVGDVIDHAVSLLDDADPADGVRLDEASARLLEVHFEVARTDRSWRLRGERAWVDEARHLMGRPTPFVGREREIATLDALFAEALDEPRARAVLVTAAAGVGKSRLRHEFVGRAQARSPDLRVWTSRCDPLGEGAAFSAIAPLVRHAAGVLAGEPPALRRHHLGERVARHVPEAERTRVTHFLGELAAAPFPDDASPALAAARADARLMSEQMLRAWEDWLDAETAAAPLLLVIEDLHWGDAASVRFIDAALRHLSGRRFMVLALARPEVHDAFPRLWAERGGQEIRLEALSPRACARLAHDVLGDAVDEDVVRRVTEHSAGNAFYLEELLRAVAEGATSSLPDSVLALVGTRLDGLDAESRRLLRAASVFGLAFWSGGVAALLGAAEASHAGEILARLDERELVGRRHPSRFPGEREYTFRHALVREAAYRSLTEADRTLAHELAARWLEPRGAEEPAVLALHYRLGGVLPEAARWYLRAADVAYKAHDLDAIIQYAEQSATCGAQGVDLGRARLHQARAHMWRMEHDREFARFREAIELLPGAHPSRFIALGGLVQSLTTQGRNDEIVRVIREVEDTWGSGSRDPEWLTARARAAQGLLHLGRADLADEMLEPVRRLFDAGEANVTENPQVLLALAGRALTHGDLGTFVALTERTEKAFERIGHLRNLCVARENLGYIYRELGCYEESARRLREVLAIAERIRVIITVNTARHNLGMTLALMGRHEEGLEMERRVIEEIAAKRSLRIEGGCRLYLSRILFMMGRLQECERETEKAIEVLTPTRPLLIYAQAIMARALLGMGRTDQALATAQAAQAMLEEQKEIEEGEAFVRLAYALALRAAGREAEATRSLGVARERLLVRAGRITDPSLRRSYLVNVPEHAQTLELSRALGV